MQVIDAHPLKGKMTSQPPKGRWTYRICRGSPFPTGSPFSLPTESNFPHPRKSPKLTMPPENREPNSKGKIVFSTIFFSIWSFLSFHGVSLDVFVAAGNWQNRWSSCKAAWMTPLTDWKRDDKGITSPRRYCREFQHVETSNEQTLKLTKTYKREAIPGTILWMKNSDSE